MAKFNDYLVHAVDDDGRSILEIKIPALGLEQAWHKAVTATFEAIQPGTGQIPVEIEVTRMASASEYHG